MLRILICPLNWGLGHATRCRPVIEILLTRGHEIHLAGDGLSLQVLKNNYPVLRFHELASLKIIYGLKFWTTLIRQIPRLMYWMIQDKIKIQRLHQSFQFDLVISDSRPGCWVNGIPNIFLINQPSPIIPYPLFRGVIYRLLISLYRKFDIIWIPDQEGKFNLSGKLIELPLSIKSKRIGFLSQLENDPVSTQPMIPHRILAIVSGPEPMRTEFELDLIKRLKNKDRLIVCGRPDQKIKEPDYISYLDAAALKDEISKAEYIVCRAGYSTLMDLASFQKKLVLVPTPGQTEQIYLAEHIKDKRQGTIWNIKEEEWEIVQSRADLMDPFHWKNDYSLLAKAVEDIESHCQKIKQGNKNRMIT